MVDPLLKAYRDRWKIVEQVERQELRTASIDLRWQQLNSILRLAKGLDLHSVHDEDQEMEVYQRWAKLKGGDDRSSR